MRLGRFLVVQVRADIPNVRIGEADDLARVARVSENFLIAGETGVENDFAAAAGGCTRRTPGKNPSVF